MASRRLMIYLAALACVGAGVYMLVKAMRLIE